MDQEAVVVGVGPDAPTVTNNVGAKQSKVSHRCDLLPALATLHVAAILNAGAVKYGDQNWRGIPCVEHLNHAMIHLFAYHAGDKTDDHIGHAACRLLMGLEKHLEAVSGSTPDPVAGGTLAGELLTAK